MKDCDKKNKCGCGVDFAPIPASLGDDTGAFAPKNGDYQDTLVKYEANGHIWFYTHDGVPTRIDGGTPAPGVTEFDDLNGRPRYAGEEMTSATDIPEVTPVTLYDTTGTATDGAMTQAAATHMIYPSGQETLKNQIAIGQNLAVGIGAVSLTTQSLGGCGDYGVEIGNKTSAGQFAVTVGSLAEASDNSIAVGSGVYAYGNYSQVIGYSARTGNSASTGNNYSMALGAYSKTSRDYEISVGAGTGAHATKFIANVTDPALPQDAATKNYVDTATSPATAWTAIGTGSSYSKKLGYVTVNLSETNITIPADTWTSLNITLPEGNRPSITMVGAVAANNNGTLEAGLIRVNSNGTIEVHTSNATTDIYGSIVFPA